MSLFEELQRNNIASATQIINSGFNLNQKDETTGEFPLHVAVKQGLVDIVELMVEKGAKLNCVNQSGLSPLHYASRKGNLDILTLLLRKGAYPAQDTYFWTPLHYAAYHGHAAIVDQLLSEPQVQSSQFINETDSNGRSALHIACKQGHLKIAHALLQSGAHFSKFDTSGKSPFHYLTLKDSKEFFLDPRYHEVSQASLCTDIKKLFKSQQFADVTFVVEGMPEPDEDGIIPENAVSTTQRIPSHRAILHARCPDILKDQPPYRTVSGDEIQISGITHTLFDAILEFVYSGGISFQETDLDFVFNLAKKGTEYNIPSLSMYAESMILSNVAEDNVISILEAAIAFTCCPRVENYCRYYIVKYFDKVAAATPAEVDKLQAAQLLPVLNQLEAVTPDPSPYLTIIDRPPIDFLQDDKKSIKRDIPIQAAAMPYAIPGAAYPVATPGKPPKQKKTKLPKADTTKVDSPRTGRNSLPVAPAAALPPLGSRPATGDAFVGRAYDLIKKSHKDLMAEPDAYDFNAPVDYVAFGLADYPYIVKNPMDLGTISKNINLRTYKTIREWAFDVRRVWDNARTYNSSESPVYQAAERMSQIFERMYLSILRQLDMADYDPFIPKPLEWYSNTYTTNLNAYLAATGAGVPLAMPPQKPNGPKASPGNVKKAKSPGPVTPAQGANRKRKYEKMTPEPMGAAPIPSVGGVAIPSPMAVHAAQHNGNAAFHAAPASFTRQLMPLTAVEIEDLQNRLSLLNEDQIGTVLQILQIQPGADGEIEINMEDLQPEIAHKLQDYILSQTKQAYA